MSEFLYKYPTSTEIDGVRYNFNTDYRIGLTCMRITDDESIGNSERAHAVIALLFGAECPPTQEALEEAKWFLQCGMEDEIQQSFVKDMDYFQDDKYIATSFMKDYRISLTSIDHLHWWEFNDLLRGLSEDTELSRVREVRNFDLKQIPEKDWKTRGKVIESKKRLALKGKISKEEQEAYDEFERLFGE